ncbi:MAG: histone deacetylase [Anaerolineales bacterium]|jgi:acetoin utilization deacetylase AcuC-like enzyme
MENFVIFYPVGHEKHFEYGHPERPDRVEAIKQKLESEGVWDQSLQVTPAEIPESVLNGIHHPEYLASLKKACEGGQRIDVDTYITPDSWQLAINAAGGGIAVVKSVWKGEAKRGFALCRPPGHHATANQAMGFCLLNNIAIATEYLLQIEGAERIVIVDIDLHHGNGTQDIFWERGDVFFFSIHEYPLYPLSGTLEEKGSGPGANTTANFPLYPHAGDEARKTILNEIILPLIDQFKPNMILMSFGFDAHWKDPLGHQLASANGYAEFVSGLAAWADDNCDGKIALFLEGGYDLEAGATSSTAICQALSGQPWVDPLGPSPIPEDERWKSLVEKAKNSWNL